jgi:hypothetical protein
VCGQLRDVHCTCTTREMKDELFTYILNETVVHYSVGTRVHNTHEDRRTHTFRPAATSSKLRLYYAMILHNQVQQYVRQEFALHIRPAAGAHPTSREQGVKREALSHPLSVTFRMNGAMSLLALCLNGIHGNDCTACNNKNMADLIRDTSATRCVTFIEITFLKNKNSNMAVVPNFLVFRFDVDNN